MGYCVPVVLRLVKVLKSGRDHKNAANMVWDTSELLSDLPGDLSQLKSWFREKMAPEIKPPADDDPSEPVSIRISTTRSDFRIKFCQAISESTSSIVKLLKNDSNWTEIFASQTVR